MRKEFLVERQGKQFVLYAGLLSMGHEQGLKSVITTLVQIPNETNKNVAICTATVTLEKDGVLREFHGIGDAAPNNVAPAMQTCLIRLAETRAKARALRDAVNVGMAALEELSDDDIRDGAPERGYASGPGRSGRSIPARVASNYSSGQSGSGRSASGGSNGFSGSGSMSATGNGNGSGNASASSNGSGENAPLPSAPAAPIKAAAPAVRNSEPTPIPAEMRNPLANPVTEAQLDAIRSLGRRRSLDVEAVAKDKFSVQTLAGLTQAQASELIKTMQTEANSRSAQTA